MRRLFRRFFPRLRHPLLDANRLLRGRDAEYAAAYAATIEESDPFVTERFEEGRRWRAVLQHYEPGKRVLDVGAGNGAVELALSAEWSVFSVEVAWNDVVRRLRDQTGAPLRRVVADAGALPFRDGAFDAITCLETVEHLRDRRAAAGEVRRVTAPRGLLLVTTPPRLRYLLRPDPHFGIRGLLLLPPSLQRAIAARRGFHRDDHYVDRIYTSVAQLRRLFRGFEVEEILSRSRAPRRWFWDAVVLRATP